jgi:hypothetical protein
MRITRRFYAPAAAPAVLLDAKTFFMNQPALRARQVE